MKKLVCLAVLLGVAGALFAQSADSVDVFAYNASQLAARFNGKTRDDVVRAASAVPAYEATVTAANAVPYHVVRYGKPTQDYRVFVFKSSGQQPLLGVADNMPSVLALNKKYQLTLALAEQEFARRMPQSFMTTVQDVARSATYRVYQNGNEFYLFENGLLTRTFTNAQDFSAFMAAITASNSAVTAQQAQQQTVWEQAQQVPNAEDNIPRYYYNSWGGIVVGGPGYGYRRPHRHTHKKEPVALQPLTPSGPPAGTVLIRDIDGKYMNYK